MRGLAQTHALGNGAIGATMAVAALVVALVLGVRLLVAGADDPDPGQPQTIVLPAAPAGDEAAPDPRPERSEPARPRPATAPEPAPVQRRAPAAAPRADDDDLGGDGETDDDDATDTDDGDDD